MTQPRLASPHTSCWLNHWSTSVSFPLCHLLPPFPPASFCLNPRPPPSLSQWLQVYKVTREAGGSRKVCQHQTVWQGKTKEGQVGPESTHCPPLYLPPRTHLQLPPCHHLTSCQDTAITEMGEKWEGGKTKEGQREIEGPIQCSRWQSWSCRLRGREDGRENMVTLLVIRGKRSQLYHKVPELVDLKIQYNHSLLLY